MTSYLKMINFADKWDQVDRLSRAGTSIRVAVDHQLNLFIGYSDDGRREFKLKSESPVFEGILFPEFENIDIRYDLNGDLYELSITLGDNLLKDLFSVISADLVSASSKAVTEAGSIQIFMNRLRRWAELVEERKSRGLTLAQQLGLLGELFMLNSILSGELVSADALLRGWRGPDGDARDMNLGGVSCEVKAALGTSKNVLNISSLDQLDTENRQLVISHYRFSPSDNGLSLASLTGEIESSLLVNSSQRIEFRRKLYLAGFDPDASYVNNSYIMLRHTVYEVSEEFPRLTKGMVHPAIRSLKYEIDCASLSECEIDEERLEAMIHGN